MVDKIQDLADHLQGTCVGLDAACESLFGHDSTEFVVEELQRLDGLVFECAGCGWWCEAGEANENVHEPDAGDLCDDCSEDEEGK